MKTELRTLKVDLGNRDTDLEVTDVRDLSLEQKLGGFGKAIYDLEENQRRHPDLRDAFDPRNLLCMDVGSLTCKNGLIGGYRTIFTSLSPLKTSNAGTNGNYFSAASGQLGPAIRSNNLDSVHLIGRAEEPSFLVIEDGKARLESADDITCREVGEKLDYKTVDEKVRYLRERFGENAAFAVPGVAGELGSRFASLSISTRNQMKKGSKHMRFAGRGGMGSVLAYSKNIQGIVVVNGESSYSLGEDIKKINLEIAQGDGSKKYKKHGTFHGNLQKMLESGLIVHRNFSSNFDERTEQLLKDHLENRGYSRKDLACFGCSVKCWKEWGEGEGKDRKVFGKIDFEPGILFGPNLDIYDLEKVMKLIDLSDDLGLDSISGGTSLGYAMEVEDRFGDFDFAYSLLKQIGEGKHGLKEGILRYAQENKLPLDIAMQVKGVEFPAYFGHLNPLYALAPAGPHTSFDTYSRSWHPMAINDEDDWVRNGERGPIILLNNLLGICNFPKASFLHLARLYEGVYGEKISEKDENAVQGLKDAAIRTYVRSRRLDYSLGFTHEDDILPGRCFETLPYKCYNPSKKRNSEIHHFNTKEFFDKVIKRVNNHFDGFQLD